jgi:hypothetical protein
MSDDNIFFEEQINIMYPTLETLMKHGQSNNKNTMSEIIEEERI